jgi:hypothetical protein
MAALRPGLIRHAITGAQHAFPSTSCRSQLAFSGNVFLTLNQMLNPISGVTMLVFRKESNHLVGAEWRRVAAPYACSIDHCLADAEFAS